MRIVRQILSAVRIVRQVLSALRIVRQRLSAVRIVRQRLSTVRTGDAGVRLVLSAGSEGETETYGGEEQSIFVPLTKLCTSLFAPGLEVSQY